MLQIVETYGSFTKEQLLAVLYTKEVEFNKSKVEWQNRNDELKSALEKSGKELNETKMAVKDIEVKLEVAKSDAEHYEFILFLRGSIERFAKQHCVNLPGEKKFLKQVQRICPTVTPSDIQTGIHFRKWLWLLLNSTSRSVQLDKLRTSLNRDINRFIWFAEQIQAVYSVLSDEVHSTGPLSIKYVQKTKLQTYLQFFAAGDIRNALTMFMISGT